MTTRFSEINSRKFCFLDSSEADQADHSALEIPLCNEFTPLTYAVARGDHKSVGSLLKLGADPNQHDLRGCTPIIYAALANDVVCGSALLAGGADIDQTDINQRSAAHYSAHAGNIAFTKWLIQAEAKLNAPDIDGRTVADYARLTPRKEHSRHLINLLGATENTPEKSGRTSNACTPPETRSFCNPGFELLARIRVRRYDPPYASSFFGFILLLAGSVLFPLYLGNSQMAYEPSNLVLIYLQMVVLTTLFSIVPFFVSVYGSVNSYRGPVTKHSARAQDISLQNLQGLANIIGQGVEFTINRVLADRRAGLRFRGVCERYILLMLLLPPIPVAAVLWLTHIAPTPDAEDSQWLILLLLVAGGISLLGTRMALTHFQHAILDAVLKDRRKRQELLLNASFDQIFLGNQSDLKAASRDPVIRSRNDPATPRDWADLPFVLFLRPFSTDGMHKLGDFSFDAILANAFSSVLPVLAISYRHQGLGPLSIPAQDEDWQIRVRELARQSQLIVMVPNHSEGVIWEIELLRTCDLLSKTVFVCPPEHRTMKIHSSLAPNEPYVSSGTEEAWQRARDAILDRNIEIPPYCNAGYLYCLDCNGALHSFGPLGININGLEVMFDMADYGDDGDDSASLDHHEWEAHSGTESAGGTDQAESPHGPPEALGQQYTATQATLQTSLLITQLSSFEMMDFLVDQAASAIMNDGGSSDSDGSDGGSVDGGGTVG